jgi:DNA-binding XRE family transcriptional regulator
MRRITVTDWKYPGDAAVRRAFAANVLRILEAKGFTLEELERRVAESQKGFDKGFYERAFGRTVKRLRQERSMTRRNLALSAGIPVRVLTQIERGHGGDWTSVSVVCRIAAALKLRPHELMAHFQEAIKQADSSRVWW